MQSLLECLPDAVMVLSGGGEVMLHNRAASALLGAPADEVLGEDPRRDWTLTAADGTVLMGGDHPVQVALAGGQPPARVYGLSRGGGIRRWVRLAARNLGAVGPGDPAAAVVLERAANPASSQSVSSLAMAFGAGASSDDALEKLFSQPLVGVLMLTPGGRLSRVNPGFADILKTTPADLVGATVRELVHPDEHDAQMLDARRMFRGAQDHHVGDARLVRADGSTAWVRFAMAALRTEDGTVDRIIAQVVDVSRERLVEDFMSRRTLFDPLTQLMNRMLLIDYLGDALMVHTRPMAVIALNLDRFKAVNDSLGQSTGDNVLRVVAERLRATLKPGDQASRISGDDFVLLVTDVGSRVKADAITRRVLDVIAEPIDVDGLRIQLSASAGVTLVEPSAGLSGDDALTQATAALKYAKHRGRARWEVFDAEMRSATMDHLRIETSLRRAIEDRGLRVAYQPVVDLRTMATDGAEALLRWHDSTLGNVAPPIFLPVAEDSGLIVPLGTFVLRESARAVVEWRAHTDHDIHVAVNMSPHQLNRPGVAEQMAEILEEFGLPATALRLEITESVLVEAGAQVRSNLADLRALGVALGIDDFGTGYASMAYLKSLPVDFVKIDRSFVTGLGSSREDTAIVEAVLTLARRLELETVAEGIEDEQQLQILTELGCELGQGYLLGRPDTRAEMTARLV